MDSIFWITLGLMIAGAIGSFLPLVPGPILSFSGLLLFFIAQEERIINWPAILFFGLGMLLLILCEYVFPILGARFSGASKAGQWGAIVGALVGFFVFPPFGIFFGALGGAFIGEAIGGRNLKGSMKAALGVVLGGLASLFLQISYALGILGYFLFKIV